MTFHISVRFLNIFKKITRVLTTETNEPVENTTVLPWILELIQKIAQEYQQNKHNSWEYYISQLNFKKISDVERKIYLIKQLNASLLLHSKHRENPWCIDYRDENLIKIHKKCCLESSIKLADFFTTIDSAKWTENYLKPLAKKNRKKYLSQLAILAHFNIEKDPRNKKPLALIHLNYVQTLDKFKKLLNTDQFSIKQELRTFNALKKTVSESKYLTVHYSNESKSVRISSNNPSRWEKIEKFTKKNTTFYYFSIIWQVICSHANLLKWINFLLIFFSLSLSHFPLIIFLVGGSVICYLILRIIFSFKKNNIVNFYSLLSNNQEAKLLSLIKQEVLNREIFNHEFNLIKKQILNFTTNITELYENIIELKKTYISTQIVSDMQLEKSSIYNYVSQVYFKSLFTSSLIINFTNVMLYGYLVSWAASVFFNVIGVAALASLISSPLGVGILIIIPITLFLLHHLIRSIAIENRYKNKVYYLLNAPCNYVFTDVCGNEKQIRLQKWKKFECLKKEIYLLETKFHELIRNNENLKNSNIYLSINIIFKDGINKFEIKNKTKFESLLQVIKKTINRTISFIAGGFYGFGLGQQIAIENKLGIKFLIKILALHVVTIIVPLILINAFANLITYHLNKRLKDRLLFAEHIDNKLQYLEYTRKKLWYSVALLKSLSAQITLNKKNHFITKDDHTLIWKNKVNTSAYNIKFFQRQFKTQIEPIPSQNYTFTNMPA